MRQLRCNFQFQLENKAATVQHSNTSKSGPRTALKSKPAQPAQRDPWAEWETRWSEEFRRFEDMERLRQRRSYEAQYAEEREREAGIPSSILVEKERAADQSAKNSYRKPQQQQQHQRRTPDPPKKEPKSTGWLPPRAPQPEPAAKASAGRSFASFAEFAAAWQAFEQRLSSGSQKGLLTAVEIPWPHSLPSVSGVLASDATADIKKKLRTALIRWHPDKWAPILEHVVEAQRGDVLSRVKEVLGGASVLRLGFETEQFRSGWRMQEDHQGWVEGLLLHQIESSDQNPRRFGQAWWASCAKRGLRVTALYSNALTAGWRARIQKSLDVWTQSCFFDRVASGSSHQWGILGTSAAKVGFHAMQMLAVLGLVLACAVSATDDKGTAFLKEKEAEEGVIKLPSGLLYKVLKTGTGMHHPTKSTSCECHYSGTLCG
ncbi:unnamed protein product [Symbiodinium sp. CCMP2592]|nr:unnamed protein product [Symbiodinium sp. CCMP2592]